MGGHLIVDGHNLVLSGEIPMGADPASPEGRGELCALLSSYARGKGLRLTVVFDGRGSGNPERTRQSFKGGTALYSSRGETADDVIRDITRNASVGTIVVTSDRGLAGTLPSRNIPVLACGEFSTRLYDFWLAGVKGGPVDEGIPSGGSPRKKGEGHKPKKQERKRDRLLRKL